MWNEERMLCIINRFLPKYSDAQLIFHYAPGQEEINDRRIYSKLDDRGRVFIDIKARGPRELYALSHYIDLPVGGINLS